MKVLVSGGWSYGNIGDEAIAKTTQYELLKIWPDADYVYFAYNQDEFYRHHQMLSQKSIHKILSENQDLKINEHNFFEHLDELKKTLFASYLNEFVENETVFIMSGGGYFVEGWKEQFLSRIIEIFLANSKKSKIFIIGQSIGPIYTDASRNVLSKALKLCDYINVRDISSYELIQRIDKSIKVTVCCDIANDIRSCYSRNLEIDKGPQEKKVISMMVSAYTHRENADSRRKNNKTLIKIFNRVTLRRYFYEAKMRQIVKYIYDRNDCTIQFVLSTDWSWDIDFTNRILRGFDRTKISVVSNATVDELCQAIKRSDFMISSKMHPLIIANSFGIPTIGISYNFKVDDFMKSIGREEYCFVNRKMQVDSVIEAFNRPIELDKIKQNSNLLAEKVKSIFADLAAEVQRK